MNGGMVHSQGPSVTTTLGMSIEAPKSQKHDDEGQLRKNTNNNSNGNYVGDSHKQEANTRWDHEEVTKMRWGVSYLTTTPIINQCVFLAKLLF
jgi:hypothetical protein